VEFEDILTAHGARYPLMEPRDYAKLAYQSHFGPEHLIADEGEILRRIRTEWDEIPADMPRRPPEDIGGGLCRFYLYHEGEKGLAAQVLCKLFCLTAKYHVSAPESFADKLSALEKLPVPGMGAWLSDYREQGCPAVGHSETYRASYAPHYRLLKKEYAAAFPALLEGAKLLARKGRGVVAIDGRCGCGKSTLGALMGEVFSCNVFHMDDFYLPKGRRTENWLTIPGGNMDLERFKEEVLTPVFAGRGVHYRPFDCSSGCLAEGEEAEPTPLTVIEGSYSHHPALDAAYDLKIFITCEKQEQLRRLQEREGDYFPSFERLWMPLEEQYIRLCGPEKTADLVIDTGKY